MIFPPSQRLKGKRAQLIVVAVPRSVSTGVAGMVNVGIWIFLRRSVAPFGRSSGRMSVTGAAEQGPVMTGAID